MNDRLIFLGTGAAEAIPAFFCRCEYCEHARKHGGKDIRSRSAFRLDENVHIDLGPDLFHQLVKTGLDVHDLTDVLITHTHSDHLNFFEMLLKDCAVVTNGNKPIRIYVSETAYTWATNMFRQCVMGDYANNEEVYQQWQQRFPIIALPYYEPVTVADYTVTPLKGSHGGYGEGEIAANYLIALPDNRMFYYASDTGYYFEETFAYLEEVKLDILVMECTFGGDESRGDYVMGHLDLKNFNLVLDRLLANGTIDQDTKVYATHINHKHPLHHDQLQEAFDRTSPVSVIVAFDGMAIE
ncbi:MBL fold metallo-hydrolase [Paenibacillus spongiae]|uniref:MBL fold metallo-hydrolase n=1 Tax=Paenibacillus spongiae TaxID=2909671 RepID=A0ABY5SCM2_9BACL|nr:MBL fold metallo-hydrolase [Paenibacillus spongiae]UVI31283.1 MBL fold metallo-hydrolase [Paenibacillus spongiae]